MKLTEVKQNQMKPPFKIYTEALKIKNIYKMTQNKVVNEQTT